MRLDQQVILVTGGASGLGLGLVERFVKEGAHVVVFDRSEAGCAAVRERLGNAVLTVVGDVREAQDNEAAVAAAVERFGKLDGVVGNAGLWDHSLSLVDTDAAALPEAFRELFDVNVLGYVNLARAAMKPLAAARGSIVYTVSQAGFYAGGGGVLYTASKHAVVGLIRQLAYEVAPYIRVNGVAPGPIPTNLKGTDALGQADVEFPADRIRATADRFVPMAHMPSPAEYAGAYVFLLSREDHVPTTGCVINHDGGFGSRGIGATPRGGDGLLAKLGIEEN